MGCLCTTYLLYAYDAVYIKRRESSIQAAKAFNSSPFFLFILVSCQIMKGLVKWAFFYAIIACFLVASSVTYPTTPSVVKRQDDGSVNDYHNSPPTTTTTATTTEKGTSTATTARSTSKTTTIPRPGDNDSGNTNDNNNNSAPQVIPVGESDWYGKYYIL